MRNLTFEEIDALLRKYPKARKIAVEDFLSTVASFQTKSNALANARKDALLYGWNAQTAQAIWEGISTAFK